MTTVDGRPSGHILVVDDDPDVCDLVAFGLREAGLGVHTALDGYAALNDIEDGIPDLVVSDVNMPGLTGFELIIRLRAEPSTAAIPVLFLSSAAAEADVLYGLSLGADDYIAKPFSMSELILRVQRRLEARPAPSGLLVRPVGELLDYEAFTATANREIARASRSGRQGVVGVLEIAERGRLITRIGERAVREVTDELGVMATQAVGELGSVGLDSSGQLLLLMPETDEEEATAVTSRLSRLAARRTFVARGQHVHLTPAVGLSGFPRPALPAADLIGRATLAATVAGASLDLRPVSWDPAFVQVARARRLVPASWRTYLQFLVTLVMGIVVPFLLYALAARLGIDLVRFAYLAVVVALVLTGVSIWVEGLYALRPTPMPTSPSRPYPPASAIIAAYLPNEADTILDTLEAFLRVEYPADLQVIVAYNTPRDLPVEEVLRELESRESRIELLKVEGSTSKAQNVNSAVQVARGEVIGVFDADHQPARDAFRRAWHWLCDEYDVVQGHCVVRNGDVSWVSRTVAVEFEAIYAVSHPGRARLHGFGIFGGSNGYWRAERLRETRMRGSMLTEDIDSSLRLMRAGGRIASDPGLLSRELAPTTVVALWNQRMRWAQGWFQVSLRHVIAVIRGSHLTVRQRAGLWTLLGWREVYPWIAIQMIPIVAFLAVEAGGVDRLDWVVPLFVLTTVFTLSVGPSQTLFAWLLAAPEIKAHRSWFFSYLVVASLLYTEFKNVMNRISQVKEFSREREWRVTPRTLPGDSR